MKLKLQKLLLLAALVAGTTLQTQAQGTAFTYQGRLNTGTNPATGPYDLTFSLFAASSGGATYAGPVTNTAVGVTNGLFTTMIDFGPGVFTGGSNWLSIGVRTNGGTTFTTLTPRQQLTPTPYAIFANSASNLLGTVPATQLSGTVVNGQLANNSVTVVAGLGLSGGGAIPLGGAAALANAGVLSVTGDTDVTAAPGTGNVLLGTTATDLNTANRIVKRDASGNFSAGTVTLAGNLNLPATSTGVGAIYAGGSLLLHEAGNQNIFAGLNAGALSAGGAANAALGYYALAANTNGNYNTAVGQLALTSHTSGYDNSALGDWALRFLTSGYDNTAIGNQALQNITNGAFNTALGSSAGINLTTGNYNIDIGNPGYAGDASRIRIGTVGTHLNAFIAGIYGSPVMTGLPVYVDAAGQLGTAAGSPVAFLGAAQTFTGTITFNPAAGAPFAVGNTNVVVNLNADLLDGQSSSAFWNVNGNGGTAGTAFLGTTDNQPLEFRVNNTRALKLDYASGLANLTVNPANNLINSYAASIAGGSLNQIQTGAAYSLIGGGYNNQLQTNCSYSVIGGGSGNQIQVSGTTSAAYGFVGGGSGNVLEAYGYYSVIAGGSANRVQYDGDDAVIGGGYSNLIGTNADYSTIPGGYNNTVNGQASFAAGSSATATHNNSFVWGDGFATASSTNRDFTVSAHGGVKMTTPRGIGLEASDNPIITRGWDMFANNAPANKIGLGRWGMFMEPSHLVLGIPGDDLSNRYFTVAKYSTNGTYSALITVNQAGNLQCNSLTILGGSDLAEPFAMSHKDIAEGSVVVIDEENPGQLKMSDVAYDTHVAGIVSGAEGVRPGIQMKQVGLLESGQNVALTGRVYVKADASNGAIKPGDLLTTSSLAGHAMKVSDHAQANGAILGKAMTGLAQGKGMVLVLVTLQ